MKRHNDRKNLNPVNLSFQHSKSPQLAEALENGLIFAALLIAIGTALYILNGQIIQSI